MRFRSITRLPSYYGQNDAGGHSCLSGRYFAVKCALEASLVYLLITVKMMLKDAAAFGALFCHEVQSSSRLPSDYSQNDAGGRSCLSELVYAHNLINSPWTVL